MKVAVTGASGFIGGYVARYLARQGYDVTGYGRRAAASLSAPVPRYQEWDFTAGPIAARGFDGVVHCGAAVSDWGTERSFLRANVDGTRAVLDAFADAPRFVHVSTSSVYSDSVPKRAVNEDAEVGRCRHSAYGRSKAAAEAVVSASETSSVILRPHIVYGPGDTTLLPRVTEASRFGRLTVPGDGSNRVSMTHVENLASCIDRALTTTAIGIFNVTDGEDASIHEFLTTMLRRHGLQVRPFYIPAPAAELLASTMEAAWRAVGAVRRPPLTRYLVAQLSQEHTLDSSRAKKVLGYAPRWNYRDGPVTL
ncbi:MAG: NAD-dependent epimerase/dehydratase [Gemmatimonadales bacterium]|nr:NAD-dependent epimerase/dehydratase [Gemmatimonadales bacterium]